MVSLGAIFSNVRWQKSDEDQTMISGKLTSSITQTQKMKPDDDCQLRPHSVSSPNLITANV